MNRRRLLSRAGLIALGLTAPGLLAGCGSEDEPIVPGDNPQGKIDLWIDVQGDANQKYFTESVVGAFEKARPKIDVNATFYKGEDLRRLIQTSLQAKSGPDVVRGPSATQTIAWSRARILADLTPYSEKFGWESKLAKWALQAFTNDGKLYALPMRVDTMLLYYNKSLFAQHGWQTPTTRAELEAIAADAHGRGIVPFGSSNVDWKAAGEWLMTVFWNHYSGPEALHQALSGQISFSDPVFVEAVELVKSYFDKGWIAGGADKYFSVPSTEIGANFGKGSVAMVPQGNWFMSQVGQYFGAKAKNDNEWDWMPMPALRQEVKYPLFEIGIGGSLAINAASKNKDAAAEYLNWYYGDKAAALKRMADVPSTYNIPVDFADSDIPAAIDPRAGRVLTAVNRAVSTGDYGYVSWTWWPPKTDVFIYEGLEQVLTGKLTPAQYCQQLADQFKAEKAEGNIPALPARGPAK
ncbi:extracellular solute-binding protein [Micromonospora sp. WMMD975]|uniref:ABC transporter substrate-binding protein n=1 Tax=Micromonospora sp. WMMD975 TaxID=3016087 RepID=UPI00249CAF94|nr:extracellular solute-binding protein [Micromonospora sp. WMMD975]WFE32750.1 extracellular solute-binding protein [Micromonospora sp. WMMD975]